MPARGSVEVGDVTLDVVHAEHGSVVVVVVVEMLVLLVRAAAQLVL